MKIVGITMMRNEADIVRPALLYHLSVGVDEVLVLDNGSSDDTPKILETIARKTGRVRWTRDDGPYRQPELMTGLAREAYERGASWILPFDADEFWSPRGGDLRPILAAASAGVLQVPVLNFVQRRAQLVPEQSSLLHMTMRVPTLIEPRGRAVELVNAGAIAFLEMDYPPKVLFRATATASLEAGNHAVGGVRGARAETEDVVCLHAPLRAYAALEAKVEQAERVESSGSFRPEQGWHVRRWQRLATEGRLEDEWRANSYEDGSLEVFGRRVALVPDDRLRDAVSRFIEDAEVRAPEPVSAPSSPAPRAAYEYPFDPNASNDTAATVYRYAREGGPRVLDLGSGPGIVAGHLARADGKRVVCVDSDAERLAAARERGVERTVQADLGDGTWLERLADEHFDVIILADVLEYLARPDLVLRSIRGRGLLAPDGFLVMSIPNVAHEAVIAELATGRFRYREAGLLDATHLRFFTRDSFVELLEREGFVPTRMHRTLIPLEHTELASLAGELPAALREHLATLPDSDVYQYVFRAEPAVGGEGTAARRAASATIEADQDRRSSVGVGRTMARLRKRADALEAENRRLKEKLASVKKKLASVYASDSWKIGRGIEHVLWAVAHPRKALDRIRDRRSHRGRA